MASSRILLLSCLIILLALQCSSAKCYEGRERKEQRDSGTGKQVHLQRDTKFLSGRKMLLALDEKQDFPGAQMLKEKRNEKSRFPSGVDENVVGKQDDYYMKESKAFLEAADEVANLMRKDYKGAGRPKRKPPINNHEPKD